MKFLSPNKVIIFELGPERLYIWKKCRRKRELGKPLRGLKNEDFMGSCEDFSLVC